MRTLAAALELDFTEPSITAAKAVADTIARNGSLQRDTLLWVMEQAYGGSSADGRWSLRDAYDMLELAEVMYLAKADLPADPGACLAALTELVSNLPRGGSLRLFGPDEQARVTAGQRRADPRMEYDP